jgi:4-amino-4-deoxychorismate lyase
MKTWDDCQDAWRKLSEARFPHWDNYLGCYSSWLGGYFREPWTMVVPLDDHGFHRGDGVFEAVRIHNRAYFDLRAHLLRLNNSAAAIGMSLPHSLDEIEKICVQLARLCDSATGILRLYVTRGPGGFSTSPREVVGHQMYAAITKLITPAAHLYEKGCRVMISSIAPKEPFWSQIKSCNYLQNVLMKQECLVRGYDFAVSVDAHGHMCEGSTENMMLITRDRRMIVPKFDNTLRGTTVQVVMKMAEQLVKEGALQSVVTGHVLKADLFSAVEAAMVGTTLGVLPISEIEGNPIGTGECGPICKYLHATLISAMSHSPELRTEF